MLEQVAALFQVTVEWSSISIPTTWTDKIALSSDHKNPSFMHTRNRKNLPTRHPALSKVKRSRLSFCLTFFCWLTLLFLLSWHFVSITWLSFLSLLQLCSPCLQLTLQNSSQPTTSPLILASYNYYLIPLFSYILQPILQDTHSSCPPLRWRQKAPLKHWQHVTTQRSHIPKVYNLQQQCHGNLKSQNLYTYGMYHIKHTLPL